MGEEFINISLPSNGVFYDCSDAKIRPFTGREYELIADLNTKTAINQLANILDTVTENIDVKNLTSGDGLYIILWEIINSYKSKMELDVVCEECTQKSTVQVDLSQINSTTLDKKDINYSININNEDYTIRPQTIGDEIEITKWANQGNPTFLYSLALTLSHENKKLIDILEELKSAKRDDIKKLLDWRENINHGPDMMVLYTCPLCTNTGKASVPSRPDLLFRF